MAPAWGEKCQEKSPCRSIDSRVFGFAWSTNIQNGNSVRSDEADDPMYRAFTFWIDEQARPSCRDGMGSHGAAASWPEPRQNRRSVRIAHVPQGALDNPVKWRFTKGISCLDNAVFRPSAAWTPTAARQVKVEGNIQDSAVNSGLAAGNKHLKTPPMPVCLRRSRGVTKLGYRR